MKRFRKGLDPVVFFISMIAYGLAVLLIFQMLSSVIRFQGCERIYITLGAFVATITTSLLAKFLEVLKLKKIRKNKFAANYVSDFKCNKIK